MKSKVLTALAILLIATNAFAEKGIVIASSVFVREAPGKGSKIVGSFKKGDAVEFSALAGNTEWVKVKWKGRDGAMIRSAIAGNALVKEAQNTDYAVTMSLTALEHGIVDGSKGGEHSARQVDIKESRVFEIVPEFTPEELRLQEENNKLASRVKGLETQIAELLPLKEEVAALRREVKTKDDQLARIRTMFPYLSVIEKVEEKGEDVLLTGIGKARMVSDGDRVIIRLESEAIPKGEKTMQRVAKERYQTGGSNGSARIYYVLNSQSLKTRN